MPDDGVSEIPIPVSEGTETMATPIDAQIAQQMAQDFHNTNKIVDHTMARFNDGSAFVAQQSKQGFLLQEKVIGAATINQLEREGLADLLVQLKSAGQMPPNTNVDVNMPKQ